MMHQESVAQIEAEDDIASLFPLDLSGQILVLRACIDASGRESGVYSLASVAFGYDNAVKANREWKALLGTRTFHMKDLNSRSEEFLGIADDEVEECLKNLPLSS